MGDVPMTYREIAAARGITLVSARRMVQRYGWHKVKGNDGQARVWVPEGVIPDEPPEPPVTPEKVIAEQRQLINWLQESLKAAEDRANRAEMRLDGVIERSATAERRADYAHERADRAEERADKLLAAINEWQSLVAKYQGQAQEHCEFAQQIIAFNEEIRQRLDRSLWQKLYQRRSRGTARPTS